MEELISLAKQAGFISEFLCEKPYKHSPKEPLRKFFWLSEVQKWLRDKHGINLLVYTDETLSFFWLIQSAHPAATYTGNTFYSNNVWCGNYEDCLEDGILTALKLIIDDKTRRT